jgi:RHS repeat-associated protein
MTRHSLVLARLRALTAGTIFAFSAFAVAASPVAGPITDPLGLAPQRAAAVNCATKPSFTGRLTAASTSTTAVTRITNANVYGYISNVNGTWGCSTGYRYSAVAWNTTATLGTFDWGLLIESTAVCNWAVGSTDFLKANGTTDCPDTDAEYAMPVTLGPEGSYNNNAAHSATGQFSWAHSACSTDYGAEPIKTGQDFSGATTGNRPGANCDAIALDNTSTSQPIVYDHTAPSLDFTTPNESTTTYRNTTATYTVTDVITEAVAGFGGTSVWKLQRQIASLTGPNSCGVFANDAATGNLTTGTTTGTINTNHTLVSARCYRWLLTAVDQNANAAPTRTSGTVVVDTTAPVVDFLTPDESTTISQSSTSYSVSWAETDLDSGVASRSLQRQKVAISGVACGTGWANDGSVNTAVSPFVETLVLGNCYRWQQMLTDRAGSTSTTATSGSVLVDTTPSTDFSSPNEGTMGFQTGSTYSVVWTETAGSGTITSRSLQRQIATITGSNTCGSFTDDGSPSTSPSPVGSTGLSGGSCYRWVETLTNSAGKTGSTTSGVILVDTTAPTASITYPEPNRVAGGVIAVTGTSIDTQSFKEYQLEYGAGASPGSWTDLGTFTTQVTAATLGTGWSTVTLGGVYTLRLTVRDNAGNATSTTKLVYLENSRRGDEAYWNRVPFDLGGGYSLGIGVANGEATLDRDLFSVPSYGPPQALSLHYSSLESATTGRFGYGWASNLSQFLTYDNGFVVWHPADGGAVPFGQVGATWTPLRGNFETLTRNASEDIVTFKDQSKVVFDNATGRLKRIENRFGKALTLVWNATTATATDASGRVTNLVIDGSGRITDATDSAGRHWVFRFNGSGDMDRITDPAGNNTDLAYAAHQLTGVTRTRSRVSGADETIVWSLGYASGKATSVTDPVSATVANTFVYNPGSTDANVLQDAVAVTRSTTRYDVDDFGRATSITQSPDGLVDGNSDYTTTQVFDGDSNLTQVFRPIEPVPSTVGQTATYTYDARGNLLTETEDLDTSTMVKTVMTYNTTNDLLVRSEDDLNDATRLVTLNSYDVSGHLTSVNANCTTTGTFQTGPGTACTGAGTQDAATNLIMAYAYTSNDQLLTETDPLGRVTKHVYDASGNETSVVANCTTSGTSSPVPPSSCTAAGTHDAQTNVTTSSAYDPATTAGKAGLATSTTDATSNATSSTYDALGRRLTEGLPGDSSIPALTRTTTYDQLGNVLTEVESWTAVTRTTTHAYDLANRQTTLTDVTTGVVTTTNYDAAGNTTQTTAGGVQTDRTFDFMGRLAKETVSGAETDHEYDGQGREFQTVDPTGATTDRVYDLAGRLLSETVSDGLLDLVTQHTYDPLGRELTTTDAAATTTNTYDRSGRLLTALVGGGTTTTAYDRNGNETRVTSPQGIVTTTVYDPLNRVTQTIGNDVASPALPTEDVTTTTYYDAAGRTVAVKDPKGITTRSIPNVRGQAKQTIANCTDSGTTPTSNPPACTGAGTHTTIANVVTTITYDGSGAETIRLVDHGDGTSATTTVAYEGGRERALQDPRGTITRTLYDGSGRVTSRVVNCTNQASPGLPTGTWYDCFPSGLNDGTWNVTTAYTYDSHGRKATETAPNGRVTTFLYDDADRLTQKIDNDVATPTQADQDLSTYFGYDDAGQQSAVRSPTLDRATFTVTRTFFDAAGRTTKEIRNCTDAGTTSPPAPDWITCQGNGTVDSDTNLVTTYAFDAKGNRISMTTPDPSETTGAPVTPAFVTTQYAYDADNRLCRVVENTTGGTNLQTLATPCSTATQDAGTATQNVSTRYTYDGSGNLATMVDARGKTTTYAYDAAAHMTGLTDPDSGTIGWTYDNLGHRTGQTNRGDSTPASPTVSWTYDGANRVLSRISETAPSIDAAAPSVPTGLTATVISASRIDLSWTAATDNVEVTRYVVTRGGAVIGQVAGAGTSYSDLSPTGSTPYSYTVTAYDAAANASPASGAANATTSAGGIASLARDAFGRTVSTGSGWGTADAGGAWTLNTLTNAGVDGSSAYYNAASSASKLGQLASISTVDQDVTFRAKVGVVPPSGSDIRIDAIGRYVDASNYYRPGIRFNNGGTLTAYVTKIVAGTTTNIGSLTTPTATFAAGTWIRARAQFAGTNPTTIRLRIWADGSPEPPTWNRTETDSTAALAVASSAGVRLLPSTGFTFPVTMNVDDVAISGISTDVTAPTVPTGLTAAAAGSTRADLSWTASTDTVGVAGYRLYRGGTYIATVGGTTWSDVGLTGGTAYSYTVAAVDAAGNASAVSASAAATTAAASVTTSYAYDPNGNRLTAVDPTGTITTAYDRLNRPTSVTLSADAPATTTYTYALASPSWTDPSGSYAVSLDKFDRQASLTDPIHGASWTTTYRADGQPLSLAAPNGNTTAFGYDNAGKPASRTTTAAGPVTRAAYTLSSNRAGQILSEASTITGDPTNGTTTYTYDPLARLTGFTRSATTTYGWDKVPNRTSVQVGAGTPVTTTYTDANRPLADTGGATGSYTSDPDGRLTSRPNQRLDWDALGRLIRVRAATGSGITATYRYDALDRLLTADEGGLQTRYRYVGQTTAVAQTVNDATNVAIRSVATDWGGERLVDWTGSGSNQRFYGTNGHHDVTWTADSAGAVSATLRYDPWGVLTSSTGSSLPDFRFQGSLYDTAADLSWVITRWYAPTLGRFISEDSLLGSPNDPPSRHLYAYAAGEPIDGWDPDGRHWYRVTAGDTYRSLSNRFYGRPDLGKRIILGNPGGRITPVNLIGDPRLRDRMCIWIPFTQRSSGCYLFRGDSVQPGWLLWGRFDKVVRLTFNAMRDHAPNMAGGVGNFVWWCGPCNIKNAARFAELVKERGPWDIKHQINVNVTGRDRVFWTAVRDDPAPETLRSDLWGLIHYGYVARAHGFGSIAIRVGNWCCGGQQSDADNHAIDIGMDLWDTYRFNASAALVRRAVLKEMHWFRWSGNAVVTPLRR